MAKRKSFDEMPYALNPHARLNEWEFALTAMPRRSVLCHKAKTCLAAITTAACVLGAGAEEKVATLWANGYTGSETIQGFQALIKLSASNDAYGFSYAEAGGTTATNIWFTSVDGATVYPHEIDTWNPSGDSFVWVRIPELVSKTAFKMHWSDDASDVPSASGNVWDGFVGVWHMNGTGTDAEPDSTSHGLGAETKDNTTGAATSIATAMGKVGKGRANASKKRLQVAATYKDSITTSTKFSVSGWFYTTSFTASHYPRLLTGISGVSNSDRPYWDFFRDNASSFCVCGSGAGNDQRTISGSLTANTWGYLTLVFDGTSATLYKDGGSLGTKTTSNSAYVAKHGKPFCIGGIYHASANRSFIGTLDEVRMFDGVLSADRVKADYDTMNAPTTFVTLRPAFDWTNAAGDGALDNPSNWAGNEIPPNGEDVSITLNGDGALSSATALALGSMTISGTGTAVFPANVTAAKINIASGVVAEFPTTGTLSDGGLTGAGTLVLDIGEGNTATMSKNNTLFTGEVVIKSGTVKLGNRHSFGFGGLTAADTGGPTAGTAQIRLKNGATFDVNNADARNWTGLKSNSVVLEGGSTITSSTTSSDHDGVCAATHLTLEGDATLDNGGQDFNFGTRTYEDTSYALINLGPHCLSLVGSASTYLSLCEVKGEGTLDLIEGTLVVRGGGRNHSRQVFLTNGLVRVRSGKKLTVSAGNKNTTATIKNLLLEGDAEVANGSQVLRITGSITGNGTAQSLTLADGAVFKPTGTGYLTVTTSLSGTVNVDLGGLEMSGRIPLFKVGTAEMLPEKSAIAFTDALPNGWELHVTDDGLGYYLVRMGFSVVVR